MRKLPLYLLLPLAMTACARNDYLVQRQTSLEGRIEQLLQAQNNAKKDATALAGQVAALKEQLAKQAAETRELQSANEMFQTKLKILASRVEILEPPEKQGGTIQVVNQPTEAEQRSEPLPSGDPAKREESVQAAYMRAFGLFSANNFPAAAEAFTTFIASYPESEYAANARFWLGECHFHEKRYKEAIESFTRARELKPPVDRSAEALYKIGLAWYALDYPDRGEAALKDLIEKYPGSDAAKQAGKQLGRK